MRKFITLIVLILAANSSFTQSWADIGVKATYGSTWLFNKNIFNDREYNHDFSFGGGLGFKAGFNFNGEIEVTAEILWETFNQKFDIIYNDRNWTQNIKMQTMEIPLFFRKNGDGAYFEIGPQYNKVRGVMETLGGNTRDVTSLFETQYFSAAIGFGSYFIGTENTALTVGLRLNYGFSDLINDAGGRGNKTSFFPTTAQPADSDYYYQPNEPYEDYAPSNPFKVMFVFELNHDLGYVVSANCKKRSKLILFGL